VPDLRPGPPRPRRGDAALSMATAGLADFSVVLFNALLVEGERRFENVRGLVRYEAAPRG